MFTYSDSQKRLSGLLLDAIYGVATKDSSDNALLLEFTKISYNSKAITAIFELIDKGEKSYSSHCFS